ncbi:HNH endonuclease [Streptomyces scabiei]|uniref:HNH endonuclease n=1 Tax=Streptomyces scabiei TaxID=1930 RepID=UPI0029B03760|nr:HNH endonuclease [Streptomyces scabiei]MDX3521956.1 HNH endonuclease [Streptomyces scabiei]
MASPEEHAHWCTGQLNAYLSDRACDVCGGSTDLALVFKKRWWSEVAVTAWAQTKFNLRSTLGRSRVTCRPCIAERITRVRAVLESGVRYDFCQDDHCGGEVSSRGFCINHRYAYMQLTGIKPRSMAPSGSGNVNEDGYRRISAPGHPNANRHGRILEHRKVLADKLGRPLRPGESAHHKNGDRLDNRPENLELWVRSQPSGQRASDLVAWAAESIELYGEEVDRGIV